MKKTKGLTTLEHKAAGGDKKAIEKLGERYAELRRRFIGKDTPEWIVEGLEKAVELFAEYGIDGEDKDALFQLAQEYLCKNDAKKHKRICELYFDFLGLNYNESKWTALNNLACRFERGEGVEKDIELSLGIFKLLTYIGHSYGQLNLAECYEEGKGTEKDLDKAIDLYKGLVKTDWRDGSKELAREKLAKHGYSEHSLDELENDYQIERVTDFMKGNFVCIELGGHIRIWSVDVQNILPPHLQDEGLITDEIKELFNALKQGGTLKTGNRSKNYPIDSIKEKEIKAIQRFRPEFGAWADAWEKVIGILEAEQKMENTGGKEYYLIVKKPDIVTVGIFWITGSDANADIIFDSETYKAIGKHFINYEDSHLDMWDGLAAKQFGGKYKRYDCYRFPRGRVLYNCGTGKTLVYADQKILDRLHIFESVLADMFCLKNYEFCFDEHYQSVIRWEE